MIAHVQLRRSKSSPGCLICLIISGVYAISWFVCFLNDCQFFFNPFLELRLFLPACLSEFTFLDELPDEICLNSLFYFMVIEWFFSLYSIRRYFAIFRVSMANFSSCSRSQTARIFPMFCGLQDKFLKVFNLSIHSFFDLPCISLVSASFHLLRATPFA